MKTLVNNTAKNNVANNTVVAAAKNAAEKAAENDALILVPAAPAKKVRVINKAPKAAKRLTVSKKAVKKAAPKKAVAKKAAPKKAAVKKAAKKAPAAPKKIGVIKTMVNLLRKKQHTAKQLHEQLILAFPERDEVALSRTVRAQTCGKLPRLQKEQKVNLKITLNKQNEKVFKIVK